MSEDGREYCDIITNLQCSVRAELEFLSVTEGVGRDDKKDILYTIESTRRRIKWLDSHPDFSGTLIDLKFEMGELPPRDTLPSATDDAPDTDPMVDSDIFDTVVTSNPPPHGTT